MLDYDIFDDDWKRCLAFEMSSKRWILYQFIGIIFCHGRLVSATSPKVEIRQRVMTTPPDAR